MIKIREYEIKNTVDELTITEFEKVSSFMNDTAVLKLEKYISIFEYLGLPEDVWDDMEIEEFTKAVDDFNEPHNNKLDFQPTIEIDGYTYRAFTDEFKVTIKDMKHIESAVKKDKAAWMAYSLAVIFKREDLTKTEHYDQAHLKQKAKLFKDLKAAIAIPYVNFVGQELNSALEVKTDEATEIVE
jgi:hypothetical protein